MTEYNSTDTELNAKLDEVRKNPLLLLNAEAPLHRMARRQQVHRDWVRNPEAWAIISDFHQPDSLARQAYLADLRTEFDDDDLFQEYLREFEPTSAESVILNVHFGSPSDLLTCSSRDFDTVSKILRRDYLHNTQQALDIVLEDNRRQKPFLAFYNVPISQADLAQQTGLLLHRESGTWLAACHDQAIISVADQHFNRISAPVQQQTRNTGMEM